MSRRACRRPNDVEIEEVRIEKGADRIQMADGCDAPDGKARLIADQGRIGLAQGLARDLGSFDGVHLIVARRDKEDRFAAGFALEDDRLGDLVHETARSFGRLKRCAGFRAHFDGHGVDPRV